MKFDVITLFPELIQPYFNYSIMKRAINSGVISVNTINPRDFSKDKHKKVDDTPYGGGAGMVLMCEPVFDAYKSVEKLEKSSTILLTPQGIPYNQELAENFVKNEQLIFICGHYEGFDERIRTGIDCIEVSIGDFVLTGGELPALTIIDSVTRLIEGTLGKIESAHYDSFSDGLLEHPHYTRPFEFRGEKVPEVLLSGNHAEIAKWRKQQQIKRTKQQRPDLYEKFLRQDRSKN
ncbi:MAG: tRNA (guanosine(37)-N1)-methyltransferase TrmD [Candidatus Gastranaerophilaceae bacterium]|jgi:tRNA (guanine37-N1)-methyltransferase